MYRVLIVEDDPQVAQINSGFLKQSGFEVAGVAANEQQAQAFLMETPVQLILLDIYLPGTNGLQILKQIRAENRPVEVIIISAAKDSMQIREAFRLGCLDYIIKPFAYERLHDALMKYQQKTELLQKNFLEQSEVDLLAARRSAEEDERPAENVSPKGIDRSTLYLVCSCILEINGWFGVQDISEQTHISRVSAKKYLDFLYEQKLLQQTYIYGNKGRPANLYQLTASGENTLRRQRRE